MGVCVLSSPVSEKPGICEMNEYKPDFGEAGLRGVC